MSPLPRSASAPTPSRIVRLSTCDATRNAIRLGKFALINPVMTFTLGRCVARIRWMPMARAFCASSASGVSISPCTVIMRSASSSITTTMYGNTPRRYVALLERHVGLLRRLERGALPQPVVELLHVPAAVGGEQLVALLHLDQRPFEHRRRVAVVGDHFVAEMRERVVHRQLDHLGIDHQEAQRLRRVPVDRGS